MMELYLPIVKISVNVATIFLLGFAGGVFSGIFGVGSGFFTIPLMMMIGIAPSYSIVASNGQVLSANIASLITNLRRGNVDFVLGNLMLTGLLVGVLLGSRLFVLANNAGVADFVISVCYVLILGTIGGSMAFHSGRSLYYKHNAIDMPRKDSSAFDELLDKLPLRLRMGKSGVTASIVLPLFASFVAGCLLSLAGMSTNFIIIPSMMYIMKIPPTFTMGTAFYTGSLVSAFFVVSQAISMHNVDVILIFILMVGSVIGSNIGSYFGSRMSQEELRICLSLIMIGVTLKLVISMMIRPDNLFSVLEG